MIKEKMNNNYIKGCFMKIVDSTAMVFLAKNANLDFLFYDMEHAMFDLQTIHNCALLAKSNNIGIFVRAPECSKGYVSRILDAGANAIMVPMVESREQAIKLRDWSKYPPLGNRGYAGGANTMYAPSGNHENNMLNLNKETITIAQIETVQGIAHVEEIVSVDGIDAIIVGPADLSISLGIPDGKDTIELYKNIKIVQDCCRKYHKAFGIIGKLELLEQFKDYLQIAISAIDTNCILESLNRYNKEYDRLLKKEIHDGK
jgi:2-keto-3-deoxy-L-rhamnonate aldolase RhmA